MGSVTDEGKGSNKSSPLGKYEDEGKVAESLHHYKKLMRKGEENRSTHGNSGSTSDFES